MKAVGEAGRTLWPERFPLEWLEAERRKKGSAIFNCQYQNDVSLLRGRVFRPEWFRMYRDPPEHLRVFQGTDLAISRTDDADYFAHVTVGRDPGDDLYVLEAFHDRLSFRQQVEWIARKWKDHGALKVGVEEVAYQRAVSQELRRTSFVPVAGVKRTADKATRACGLSAFLEAGRIFFRRDQTDLMEELVLFPEGEHDDLVDALEMAVDLATRMHVPGYW
jgi:predicted phage terminase large subunit-like protein